MAVKALFVICASVLLAKSAHSVCLGAGYAAAPLAAPFAAGCGYGYDGLSTYNGLGAYGYGAGCGCGIASTGGGLPCASASPIPPAGVSVLSENVYEGALSVGGNLPFLGTVSMEGLLPTAGAGAVSYGCGAGGCGIAVEEGPIATGIAPSVGYGPGFGGYGAGLSGFNGLGYGGIGGYGGFGYGLGGGRGCAY